MSFKTASSTGLRKNVYFSTTWSNPKYSVWRNKNLSTIKGHDRLCACKALLLPEKELIHLFRSRNLQALPAKVPCPELTRFDFRKAVDCKLMLKIEQVSESILLEQPDVIYTDDYRYPMLASLKNKPQGMLGDITGDYGKQMSAFLKACYESELMSPIGSIIDVGGQNTSTVDLISQVFHSTTIPSIILDINSLTPYLSPVKKNIRYAIGDAYQFFSSDEYEKSVQGTISSSPNLVVFNNTLNVLTAKDGWKTLSTAWERLRSKDYLVISGLVPEQLIQYRLTPLDELDGIMEFHDRRGFYKSALKPDFSEFLEKRLKLASVIVRETFEYKIEFLKNTEINVQGYRLLTLRKN